MKSKSLFSGNIILFVGIVSSLFFGQISSGCQPSQPKSQKQADEGKTTTGATIGDSVRSSPQKSDKLVVYYFHGNIRCPTCYKLENYAKSVVESDFADAIKNGKLEWKTINIEDKGNEHFGNDYKLYTKSVIVSTQKDGKEASWKNLDQIWQLIGDQAQYMDYIRKEVRACLEGKCL